MNDQADTERTAARLRAALSSAADVMVIHDAPARVHINPAKQRPARNWGRLAPLAAAAGVVVVAAGTVIGTHLASTGGTHAATATGTTGTTAPPARPEFYLTVTYPASGQNVLQFQVRRTDGGAVTGEKTIPAGDVGWGGYLASGAGDRTFYFAHYPCTTSKATPRTTFDRITVSNAGQISGFASAGQPVQGMVTAFAVSPGGSQVAYNALPGACATGNGFKSTAVGSVSVEDLSTGAVRTWQDTASSGAAVGRLSWTPDGRSLIVDEAPRGLNRSELTVFALDADSAGGSLQAHSTTLLQQQSNCSTCVATALAGSNGSLIELESQTAGQGTRVLVVRVPAKAGSHGTVLYTGPSGAPANAADNEDLFTDSSGTWPLLWPGGGLSARNQNFAPAGWISGGQLHPLPGIAQIFPQGVAR